MDRAGRLLQQECFQIDSVCIQMDKFKKHYLRKMINCDFENFGCKGGHVIPAIDFLITVGTTTYKCFSYKNDNSECAF